jgi:stage V sporulation protein R
MAETTTLTHTGTGTLLFNGSDWDFDTLKRTYEAIETIAFEDLGLDVYQNQIEIISTE